MLALVVEDDVPIRRLVRGGLERQGIDVTEAGTVEDALCSLAAQVEMSTPFGPTVMA